MLQAWHVCLWMAIVTSRPSSQLIEQREVYCTIGAGTTVPKQDKNGNKNIICEKKIPEQKNTQINKGTSTKHRVLREKQFLKGKTFVTGSRSGNEAKFFNIINICAYFGEI